MSLLSKGFEPLFGSLDPGRIRIRIKVTSRGSATLAEDNILMGASLFFIPWTFLLARVFTFFFVEVLRLNWFSLEKDGTS
jgi:hypothetical protein